MPESTDPLVLGAHAMERLERSGLSGTPVRVLLHLCRTADEHLRVVPTQQQVADRLGTTQAAVSRSMAQLTTHGFLTKRGNCWRLRPEVALPRRPAPAS